MKIEILSVTDKKILDFKMPTGHNTFVVNIGQNLMPVQISIKENFEYVAHDFMKWSVKTFEKATAIVSLAKARHEMAEVADKLMDRRKYEDSEVLEEYADVFMCVLHSAAKAGFTAEQLVEAIAAKAEINYKRTWKLNEDNTYSHVK